MSHNSDKDYYVKKVFIEIKKGLLTEKDFTGHYSYDGKYKN